MIVILGLAARNIPHRLPRGLLVADAVKLDHSALATKIICPGLLVGTLPGYQISMRLCRCRPQPCGFLHGSVEFHLGADDGSHRHGMAGQSTEQFPFPGHCLIDVIAHSALRLDHAPLCTAKRVGLNGQGVEGALFALATELGKALQYCGHWTISRIWYRVSSIAVLAPDLAPT
jgi:hypothetical protein